MKSYNSAFDLLTDDKAIVDLLIKKSLLMDCIVDRIHELRITQSKAAEIAKVTQPRISNLKNCRISMFSYDILFLINERLSKYKD